MLVAENLKLIMIGSELTEFTEILKKLYLYAFQIFVAGFKNIFPKL